MVDFNKLLSPERQADLSAYRKSVAECMARTDADMLGHAMHIMHNASAPRDFTGVERNTTDRDYTCALHFIVLPELIRRLAGGVPPQACHVCDTHVDWSVALMVSPPDQDDIDQASPEAANQWVVIWPGKNGHANRIAERTGEFSCWSGNGNVSRRYTQEEAEKAAAGFRARSPIGEKSKIASVRFSEAPPRPVSQYRKAA